MPRSSRFTTLASLLTASSSAFLIATHALAAPTLTFDERVQAQEAIERVYYRH